MLEMRAKLEKIFVERAMLQPVEMKRERMSLGELLYHAMVECGESCRLLSDEAMAGL